MSEVNVLANSNSLAEASFLGFPIRYCTGVFNYTDLKLNQKT